MTIRRLGTPWAPGDRQYRLPIKLALGAVPLGHQWVLHVTHGSHAIGRGTGHGRVMAQQARGGVSAREGAETRSRGLSAGECDV